MRNWPAIQKCQQSPRRGPLEVHYRTTKRVLSCSCPRQHRKAVVLLLWEWVSLMPPGPCKSFSHQLCTTDSTPRAEMHCHSALRAVLAPKQILDGIQPALLKNEFRVIWLGREQKCSSGSWLVFSPLLSLGAHCSHRAACCPNTLAALLVSPPVGMYPVPSQAQSPSAAASCCYPL